MFAVAAGVLRNAARQHFDAAPPQQFRAVLFHSGHRQGMQQPHGMAAVGAAVFGRLDFQQYIQTVERLRQPFQQVRHLD